MENNNLGSSIDKIVGQSKIQPSLDYLQNAGYNLDELKKENGFLNEFKRLNKNEWSDEELNHLNNFSKHYFPEKPIQKNDLPIDYENIFDTTGDAGLYARRLKEEWQKRPNLNEVTHKDNKFVKTNKKDLWGEDIWDIYSNGKLLNSGSYKDVAKTIRQNIHNDRYSKLNDNDLINKAINEFGITQNFNGAMYMLPNGQMLDGSWGTGKRGEDHRSIGTIYPALDYEYQGDYMRDFMKRGSIRLMPENNSVEIMSMPTEQQIQQLKNLFARGYIKNIEANGNYLEDVSNEKQLENFIRKSLSRTGD